MNAEPDIPPAGSPFRLPPHNIEAEKAVLGSILVFGSKAMERFPEGLLPEHFILGEHGRIFAACQRLLDQDRAPDPVNLKRLFESDEGLASIGGPSYLMDLAKASASPINAGEYARLIHDLARKRRIIAIGEELVGRAYGADVDLTAEDLLEGLDADLTALAEEVPEDREVPALAQIIDPALREMEAAWQQPGDLAGLSTGLRDLDALLGGMAPGDLIIAAGATSSGKTAFALGVAEHNAKRHRETEGQEGAAAAIFSLEMSRGQLVNRLLSRKTGISAADMRRGHLGDAEWKPINVAAGELRPLPLFIDDRSCLTVAQVRSRARRIQRRHGLGLVLIDYLQLLQADATYRGQRVNEVGEISRGLKAMAKDLGVPVIALSQLSREVDRRDNKRPVKADLRESGSLEQDADSILMLHREEYWLEQGKPNQGPAETEEKFLSRLARWEDRMEKASGKAEVIVAKNRHGPTGTVTAHFNGQRMMFANLQRVGGRDG